MCATEIEIGKEYHSRFCKVYEVQRFEVVRARVPRSTFVVFGQTLGAVE